MEKNELLEILDSVQLFRSNIKECDSILNALRQIRIHYDQEVEQPRQILDKLKELESDLEHLRESYSKTFAEYDEKIQSLFKKQGNGIEELLKKISLTYAENDEKIQSLFKKQENGIEELLNKISLETDQAEARRKETDEKVQKLIENVQAVTTMQISLKEDLLESVGRFVQDVEKSQNELKNNLVKLVGKETRMGKFAAIIAAITGSCALIISIINLIFSFL